MNHYAAREITISGVPTGKYHYTVANGGDIRSVGYCSPFQQCPHCNGEASHPDIKCGPCVDSGVIFIPNFCPGHATKEEACEHYRQYLLDRRTQYGKKQLNQQTKCQVCGEWTQLLVQVGGMQMYTLCEKHNNRASLEKLLEVHESYGSD